MVKRLVTGEITAVTRVIIRDLMQTRGLTWDEASAFYQTTGRKGQEAMKRRAETRLAAERRAAAGNPEPPRGLAFVKG